MNTTKHALDDRVLVMHVMHVTARGASPPVGRLASEWLPGELISAEHWHGRERYVTLLDDGRRLVAFDDHVREVPPWESVSATELEAIHEPCGLCEIAAA